VGTRPTCWLIELAEFANFGCLDRDLSAHGLRILVVALGQPYDPALLAVPQCAPYRLDLDVSTAARFHFGEMVFSIGFLALAVVAFGIPPIMLLVFFLCLEVATLFHHSNWRLPIRLERILNSIVVTPRMHGIHHSIVQRETNSNWGTVFCWWDKLHRTLRRDIPQNEITIGVAAYRDEKELTFGQLLVLPFRKQREWRLPNGLEPDRKPRPSHQLAE